MPRSESEPELCRGQLKTLGTASQDADFDMRQDQWTTTDRLRPPPPPPAAAATTTGTTAVHCHYDCSLLGSVSGPNGPQPGPWSRVGSDSAMIFHLQKLRSTTQSMLSDPARPGRIAMAGPSRDGRAGPSQSTRRTFYKLYAQGFEYLLQGCLSTLC